ncbi:MAG: hypothetical protein Kow0098_04090 [Ignavibacteriaceae bacterium]
MNFKKAVNYAVPALLAILIFASDFLNTGLFVFGEYSFTVWFVLSLLCFACGWYINKTLQWHFGGKVVFATIVAVTIITVLVITFFYEYFGPGERLVENLILFGLRNITLGTMAFFGMAVEQVLATKNEQAMLKEKLKFYEQMLEDYRKQSELELKEAQLEAKRILQEADLKAKNTILKKQRIEEELKEFIQAEKELIKKYENL